jgi:hypothetical protein
MADYRDGRIDKIISEQFWADLHNKVTLISELAKVITDHEVKEAQQRDEALSRLAGQIVVSDEFWAGVARRKILFKRLEQAILKPTSNDVAAGSTFQVPNKRAVKTNNLFHSRQAGSTAAVYDENDQRYWEVAAENLAGPHTSNLAGPHTDAFITARSRRRTRKRRQDRHVDPQPSLKSQLAR